MSQSDSFIITEESDFAFLKPSVVPSLDSLYSCSKFRFFILLSQLLQRFGDEAAPLFQGYTGFIRIDASHQHDNGGFSMAVGSGDGSGDGSVILAGGGLDNAEYSLPQLFVAGLYVDHEITVDLA